MTEVEQLNARIEEMDAQIKKLQARIRNPRPSRRVKRLTARFAKALRTIADMPCSYAGPEGIRCEQDDRQEWCASCIAERALKPLGER